MLQEFLTWLLMCDNDIVYRSKLLMLTCAEGTRFVGQDLLPYLCVEPHLGPDKPQLVKTEKTHRIHKPLLWKQSVWKPQPKLP